MPPVVRQSWRKFTTRLTGTLDLDSVIGLLRKPTGPTTDRKIAPSVNYHLRHSREVTRVVCAAVHTTRYVEFSNMQSCERRSRGRQAVRPQSLCIFYALL